MLICPIEKSRHVYRVNDKSEEGNAHVCISNGVCVSTNIGIDVEMVWYAAGCEAREGT